MSTPSFVSKQLNQTMVYWPSPVNDGYGGKTFGVPVEVPARCEYRIERAINAMGNEVLSKAFVYLEQEVEEGAFLYLGSLSDIDADGLVNPSTVKGSMIVLTFLKIPRLASATEFIYKAYANTLYRS